MAWSFLSPVITKVDKTGHALPLRTQRNTVVCGVIPIALVTYAMLAERTLARRTACACPAADWVLIGHVASSSSGIYAYGVQAPAAAVVRAGQRGGESIAPAGPQIVESLARHDHRDDRRRPDRVGRGADVLQRVVAVPG